MNVSIIIPAYNEEKRIEKTLVHYCNFFDKVKKEKGINTRFIVVLNGCKDRTLDIVKKLQETYNAIQIINLEEAGKGLAVTTGFGQALKDKSELIGFVDADMATKPQYFYELIEKIGNQDVIFCSRYMKESKLIPERPFIKKWGRELIFNPLVRLLMGIKFRDFQCGAKLFKSHVIKKILPSITMKDWAFDVELIYLSKKHGFALKEIPTTWYDQQGSKFDMVRAGSKMLGSIVKLRLKHSRVGHSGLLGNKKNN
ncbi:glycosyltransferase [Candidatus Dependentiae bacterium]